MLQSDTIEEVTQSLPNERHNIFNTLVPFFSLQFLFPVNLLLWGKKKKPKNPFFSCSSLCGITTHPDDQAKNLGVIFDCCLSLIFSLLTGLSDSNSKKHPLFFATIAAVQQPSFLPGTTAVASHLGSLLHVCLICSPHKPSAGATFFKAQVGCHFRTEICPPPLLRSVYLSPLLSPWTCWACFSLHSFATAVLLPWNAVLPDPHMAASFLLFRSQIATSPESPSLPTQLEVG